MKQIWTKKEIYFIKGMEQSQVNVVSNQHY